jgi:hypothetical protein
LNKPPFISIAEFVYVAKKFGTPASFPDTNLMKVFLMRSGGLLTAVKYVGIIGAMWNQEIRGANE